MTKTEKSLLLYLETVCVDQSGVVDLARLNADDIRIGKEWHQREFLVFRRYTKTDPKGEVQAMTYLVEMTDESWKKAHELKRERAERNKKTTAPCYPEDLPSHTAYVKKELKRVRKRT